MKKTMKTHWVADLYPLNDSDVQALAESIKANGQQVPILITKDGDIIDGRNRWLACEIAGKEPITQVINPDGAEVTDEEAERIACNYNSARRDLTKSTRACSAAEAWKRMHPDGQQKTGRSNHKNRVNYPDFAARYKVSKVYAERALAILNHSPDLMTKARESLPDAYAEYQARVKKEKEEQRIRDLLAKDENADIRERVDSGALSLEEAVILIKQRDEEEEQRRKDEQKGKEGTARFLRGLTFYHNYGPEYFEQIIDELISDEGFADTFRRTVETLAKVEV